MDQSAKVPLSHTLWSPYDTVKDAAEAFGIDLPDDAARNLAMDVEYRIHEILETAIRFMRHSKRKLLMTSDINSSLRVLNIEPLYGYDSSQTLNFKEALIGAGGQTLYYIDETEMELEKLVNQELPKVPRQATFTAHWLAIEGVQPIIPQNPLPSEIRSLPPIVRGATSSYLGVDVLNGGANEMKEANNVSETTKNKKEAEKELDVKPLVKHILSKELKLYFDKVVEVLVSTDPEKEHLKFAALNSLKNDPGLHQLVPYFIQFVAQQVTNQLGNIEVLSTMLEVLSALADNKTIFLEPYVHALMPCILTLLLAKRIGPAVKDFSDNAGQEVLKKQLAIREFAAILLEHIIKVYGSSYSTLRSRVTRTLLRALLDSSKPTGTHYGALLAFMNMDNEVIKLVVVGNLKMWCDLVVEDSGKSDFERQILLNTALETLKKLKIPVKLNSHEMDVDENDVPDELKEKLKSRIGDKLAEMVLEDAESKEIIRGIYFGEENV